MQKFTDRSVQCMQRIARRRAMMECEPITPHGWLIGWTSMRFMGFNFKREQNALVAMIEREIGERRQP